MIARPADRAVGATIHPPADGAAAGPADGPVGATVVVTADLDRTLIYSPASLALEVPDELAPRLLCVETYRGEPLSFMTEAAAATLIHLQRAGVLVPATTRTPAQLARVHLPGPPARFAIASNGGHLLVDGVEDAEWSARVRARLAACAPLTQVSARLRAVSAPATAGGFVHSHRVAADLFVYLVVERADLPAGWLEEVSAWCADRGWVTSLQGRKLYCVPVPLTKGAAAREVLERTGGSCWVAAGDSLLDQELLAGADEAIRPAHGELHEQGWTPAGLQVTAAGGVLAGEEIASWLLTRSTSLALGRAG